MISPNNPAVTVIMPVYNSEQYLLDAVLSVLAEDFDLELLLVDDGSTDGSGILCDACAEADSRVTVLHKKNGGMCQARNLGIEYAKGTYVTFCDNDDCVLSGFVQDNYEIAARTNAESVRFGRVMRCIDDDDELLIQVENKPAYKGVLDCEDIFERVSDFFYGTGGVWSGLYSTSFLREHAMSFDEDLRQGFEDIIFNNQVFLKAERVAFNPHSYYVWKRRSSHSSSMELGESHLLGLDRAMESFEELVDARDGLMKAPDFCSEWLIGCVKECLTVERYKARGLKVWDKTEYRRIRDILVNHARIAFAGKPPATLRVIRDLLLAERYRELHAYIVAGVEFKKLSRRILGDKQNYG